MIVILMGVSGVGKTTVGEFLARDTGWPLYDADDFHSPANIEKMRNGIALTDEDRWPWLDRLNGALREIDQRGGSALLACSALKQRIDARKGHYMTAKLLESQFAALEAPTDAIVVDVGAEPQQLAAQVYAALGLAKT